MTFVPRLSCRHLIHRMEHHLAAQVGRAGKRQNLLKLRQLVLSQSHRPHDLVCGREILTLNIVGTFHRPHHESESQRQRPLPHDVVFAFCLLRRGGRAVAEDLPSRFVGRHPQHAAAQHVWLEPVDWIQHPVWMPIIGVLFVVWQGIGFTVIFFLAGLQGIDETSTTLPASTVRMTANSYATSPSPKWCRCCCSSPSPA